MKLKTIVLIVVLAASVFAISNTIYNEKMVDVNITFENKINTDFLDRIDASVSHRFESFQGVSITIPEVMLPLLDSSPFIKTWEYDTEVTLMADSIDWGVDRINAERVWGGAEDATDVTGTCGTSVKVAVIDTGVDTGHSDLNVAGGYDYVNNDNNPDDDQGHGTHVAGTIAALDNGAGLVGVAPCVELYAVKVLDSQGSGTSADVAAGIEWAGDNGMDIASLSLGSSSASSTIESAGQYAYSQGVLLVAASGNSGTGSIGYPAAFSEFIAVGATDQNNNLASFSQYGAEQEIVAPGVDIQSTYNGGGYATLDGTSMATPHVSAAAALVMSADSSLSRDEVRSVLRSSATDLGSSGWDSTYGYGLLDAEAAVNGGGGGGGGDPGDNTLTNGETVTSSLSGTGDSETWTIEVDSNAQSMRVQLDSGSSDFDFFASDETSSPTHSNNVFEGWTYGGEDETHSNPDAGTWYIVVDSYSGSGSYDLTVTVEYGDGGGGGSDTFALSIYTYDWDISGEVDLIVNGYELNWEAQGLSANNGYKTYSFDITSIAGSSLTIELVDTYGSYTNYFSDLIVYRNGAAESNLQDSWVETPGSGVTYTYAL